MGDNLGPQFDHPKQDGYQLSPDHPKGGYQMSLPGMSRPELGASRHIKPADEHDSTDELHVSHLFKHPEVREEPYRYLSSPQFKRVKTANLRPTQPIVHEDYLYEKSKSPEHPEVAPVAGKRGTYDIVDGHHRVARALLSGQKTLRVEVHGAP